ncbi:DUF3558 domain-containing protein [Nocardia sp. NRRL S-836]|uniref:DUF3558 domain-containing protein n=1 Tax=Nocardia sp. NRRL S-836 TaxID=1519492 RepID=UPI0006AF5A17|nr:DUF3558 domain-containing protein [Nocardia sp. NRRL S-836]KOV82700.1 hypothetical protein ADL03_23290 [Nocardia sp. NRRL S-836]
MRIEQLRIRGIAVGTISAIAVLLAAGCGGGGTAGTPAPTPTSQSSGSGGDTTANGAPKVKSPLAWDRYRSDPCSVLTTDQLAALGVPGVTGKVNPTSPGPSCIWQGQVSSQSIAPSVGFPTGDGGLDYLYEAKDTYKLFQVLPAVQGYPAVLASAADQRASGNCAMAVGITDSQIVSLTVQISKQAPRYADPCGLLTEIANQVVTNIKAGAK